MKNSMVAAQLFTLREYLKTPEDIEKSLTKVKRMGYDVVQASGLGPIEPERLKEIIDKLDIKICITHTKYPRLKDDIENVIKEHKLWNCDYVGLGSMPDEYRKSKEGFLKFAKEASEIGKKLADNGLKFLYHNHNFEFTRFDGELGFDILLNETDPETFGFEIDTYWVQAGGADPAKWVRKVKGRTGVVHLKDMNITLDREQIMAEVGEGNMNWDSILEACKEVGMEWYAVEQDKCNGCNPFDCLETSLKNLKAMGLE